MNYADINYVSIHGKYIAVNEGLDEEEIVEDLHELLVFDGGKNPQKFEYDSYLKISYPTNGLELDGVTVRCGKENAVDMDHVFDCYIYGTFGSNHVPGRQIINIRGGSSDVTIIGKIACHGKECDVIIGDWSDKSKKASRNITIDLKSTDGKPVKVCIGHAADITLRGDCQKAYFPSLGLKLRWWKQFFQYHFLSK